jgi:uncharacterized protein YukE
MTDTDPPNKEGTDEAAETPTYKSPLEQMLEKMPIFGPMFSSGSGKSGGGGSGKFELSLEEMEDLHSKFTAEVRALDTMLRHSSQARQNLSPITWDDASQKHFERTQNHFGELQSAVQQQRDFAEKFADAIKGAIDTYKQNEDSASADFRSQGNNL